MASTSALQTNRGTLTIDQADCRADRRDRVSGVASFACSYGARDEVREPAPATLPCWDRCDGTMKRFAPKFAPPAGAGRILT